MLEEKELLMSRRETSERGRGPAGKRLGKKKKSLAE